MVNYDPELDPVLNEAIEIWDAELSKLQQSQIHQIQQPTQIEIKCSDQTDIRTLQPPITLINLQPACSAFSPLIKLSPYFKQYSKSFHWHEWFW